MTNVKTDASDRSMTRTYVAVIVIEALVLVALWAAQRHFASF
jgi:hypothetical protein